MILCKHRILTRMFGESRCAEPLAVYLALKRSSFVLVLLQGPFGRMLLYAEISTDSVFDFECWQ